MSKSNIVQSVDGNIPSDILYKLNPHALSFSPPDLASNNNIFDQFPSDASTVTSIPPPKSHMSVFNLGAKVFVPKHRALVGVRDRELCVHKGSYFDDPILNIIEKLKDHPSIVSINQRGYMPNSFSFQFVSDDVVSMVINDMDSSKAYQKNNIPPPPPVYWR